MNPKGSPYKEETLMIMSNATGKQREIKTWTELRGIVKKWPSENFRSLPSREGSGSQVG